MWQAFLLHLAGKLGDLLLLPAVAAGQQVNLTGQHTSRRYLVDMVASYSIYPRKSNSKSYSPYLHPAGARMGQLPYEAEVSVVGFCLDFLADGPGLPNPGGGYYP
jgi:hypothetical protein